MLCLLFLSALVAMLCQGGHTSGTQTHDGDPEWQLELESVKKWIKERVSGLERDFSSEDEYAMKLNQIVTLMTVNETVAHWLEDEDPSNTLSSRVPRRAPHHEVPQFHCQVDLHASTRVRRLNTSSSPQPINVHGLHPWDIRVIGAMGDSLTAGTGILAKTVFGILLQDHGHSFSIGGHGNYETTVTLPNILRKWSKGLKGHSIGKGALSGRATYLNVAAPGSKSKDMFEQAQILVDRMRQMKGIDFHNDWKIVTMFVGANDLCNYCFNKKDYSAQQYKKNLMQALDYLYKHLPKVFINLLETVDVSLSYELQHSGRICNLLQSMYMCRCATNIYTAHDMAELKQYIRDYQQMTREIAADPKYDGREDFTIVNQPLFRYAAPPKMPGGRYDISLLAPDCFHFNHRGHSLAALGLWKNMFEPVGEKSDNFFTSQGLHCPVDPRQYFATKFNSLSTRQSHTNLRQ